MAETVIQVGQARLCGHVPHILEIETSLCANEGLQG